MPTILFNFLLQNRENEIIVDTEQVTFEIEADKDWYSFYYRLDNGERVLLGKGETVYITTEVGGSFTGNYFAMYAMGNGKKIAMKHGKNYSWVYRQYNLVRPQKT